MAESLLLSHMPKWKYAGKLAESAISTPAPEAIAQEDPKHSIVMAGEQPYKIIKVSDKDGEKRYLVPHYQVDDPKTSDADVHHRDIRLLNSRVRKFFYFAQRGLDVSSTKEQASAEMSMLLPRFKDFRFDKPYREHTEDERELIAHAAHAVGHAVNRLEALGEIIIQGERGSAHIEYDDAYIANHMDSICKEFYALWSQLCENEEGQRMCACVMTRDGYKDRDGVFAHLTREILKPVMGHINNKNVAGLEAIEAVTRNNLVQDIGSTMLAIDQVHMGMQVMMEHERFSEFATQTQAAINRKLHKVPSATDLDISNYRGMVREYVELSRARAGIRSEDFEDFRRANNRLTFLRGELDFSHQAMKRFAEQKGDKIAQSAIPLLDRGIDLITEMSELRLPRNNLASGIDGRESTVQRYTDKVQGLLDGKLKGRGIGEDDD